MRAYRPIADRRRQLVEAGLTIAERDGVANVTVRRVAAEAGVSLGLVSYCFGSKGELTLAMATRIVEELVEHSDPGPAIEPVEALAVSSLPGDLDRTQDPPDPADERAPDGIGAVLRGALAGLWQQVERTPGRQLLTYEITTLALRDQSLQDVAEQQYKATVILTVDVLERAARSAGVTWTRDLDEVAGLVVMAIDGATLRWLVDKDSGAALTRLGDVADLLTTMTA